MKIPHVPCIAHIPFPNPIFLVLQIDQTQLTSRHHILLLFKNFSVTLFSASHDLLKALVLRIKAISWKIYLLQKNIPHLR